jgi:hypothetical protein
VTLATAKLANTGLTTFEKTATFGDLDSADFAGSVDFKNTADFGAFASFTGTGPVTFEKAVDFAADAAFAGSVDFKDIVDFGAAVAFTGTDTDLVTFEKGVTFIAAAYFTGTSPVIFEKPVVFADTVIPSPSFGGKVDFKDTAEFAVLVTFIGTGPITFGNTAVFGGMVYFADSVTFKDDVTIADTKTILVAPTKSVTLYPGKSIINDDDPDTPDTPLLIAGAGDNNLVLNNSTGSTAYITASGKMLILDNAVVTGGNLVVAPEVTFNLASALNLASGSKLTLSPAAVLTGAGIVADTTTISGGWKAETQPVVFEPNKISGAGGVLISNSTTSFITLAPTVDVPIALEISGVEVRLVEGDYNYGIVQAVSGTTQTATLTLSGGAKISGLQGFDGDSSVPITKAGIYAYAEPDNLEAVNGDLTDLTKNYLRQQAAGDAKLTVDAGRYTEIIGRSSWATTDGNNP